MGETAGQRVLLALAAVLLVAGAVSVLAARPFGITQSASRPPSFTAAPTSGSSAPSTGTTATTAGPSTTVPATTVVPLQSSSPTSSTSSVVPSTAASTSPATSPILASTGSSSYLPTAAAGITLVLLGFCVVAMESGNEELMAPLFYQPKHSRRRRRRRDRI